jgi:hypothetical protein
VFIPNKEIRQEYYNSITVGSKRYPEIAKALRASHALLEAAWAGDADAVAAGVEAAHFETSQLTYNSETALSYVVSIAFYAAREYYNIFRELPAGKGFADIVFLPKVTKSSHPLPHSPKNQSLNPSIPQSFNPSILQSLNPRRPQSLEAYKDNLLLIGITYDKTTKHHACEITLSSTNGTNLHE